MKELLDKSYSLETETMNLTNSEKKLLHQVDDSAKNGYIVKLRYEDDEVKVNLQHDAESIKMKKQLNASVEKPSSKPNQLRKKRVGF